MSLQSLPGLGSESRHWLTIGSDGWLPTAIVLHSLFLPGPSTGRAPAVAPHPLTNFLTLLSLGLATQIRRRQKQIILRLRGENYWPAHVSTSLGARFPSPHGHGSEFRAPSAPCAR